MLTYKKPSIRHISNTKASTLAFCVTVIFLVSGCAQSEIPKSPGTAVQSQPQCSVPCSAELTANSFSAPTASALPPYSSRLLLADINEVYTLSNAELNREISRLSNSTEPHARIKLALLLSRTHQAADTQRALNLLTSVIAQSQGSANSWYLWAQLLYPVLEDQHKLLLQLSQQSHNLRENNRLIEELNRKIDALRAIETSLNTRAP